MKSFPGIQIFLKINCWYFEKLMSLSVRLYNNRSKLKNALPSVKLKTSWSLSHLYCQAQTLRKNSLDKDLMFQFLSSFLTYFKIITIHSWCDFIPLISKAAVDFPSLQVCYDWFVTVVILFASFDGNESIGYPLLFTCIYLQRNTAFKFVNNVHQHRCGNIASLITWFITAITIQLVTMCYNASIHGMTTWNDLNIMSKLSKKIS